MQAKPDLATVIADGRWLAHRYDETHDAIHFRLVDRARHRATPFLKDSELGEGDPLVFRRDDCVAAAKPLHLQPPRFIFHSAYCCSTLLARAFDQPGVSMGFSEPTILTDVVELQLKRRDPRQVAAALDAALTLLARPIEPNEVNVIKPSNVLNPMIPAVLAMRPETRAVLLYAPLENFVASIARKEIEGRDWARLLMGRLIRLGQAERFGLTEEELYRQTDLQVAAMGWLAQHALFAEHGTDPRIRTLDSETLLARAPDCLKALGELFAIDLDAEAAVAGPAFQKHSKDGSAYGAEQRRADKEAGLSVYRREIEVVTEWSRRLAEFATLPRELPGGLLADAGGPAL